MSTATSSVNLGSRGCHGGTNSGDLQPAGTADVTVTINLATVKLKGDFLNACRQIADHLGLK